MDEREESEMFEYLSFLIDGDLNIHYAGKLDSYIIIRDFHPELPNGLMEAEWTSDRPDYLTIRPEDKKMAELTKKLLINKYPTRKDFIKAEIKSFKTKNGFCYYRGGKLHREDGPAIQYSCGVKKWLVNGELHREDGPAVEYADGGKQWWVNGKRHREGGPAVEYADGGKQWWVNGKRHRTNGPAIEWPNGNKQWWIDGKRHRTDGPAVEYPNQARYWYYLNGELQHGK